jgi:hypothetical protein
MITKASTNDEIFVSLVTRSMKKKDRSDFLKECSECSKGFDVARYAGALAKRFQRLVRDTRSIVATGFIKWAWNCARFLFRPIAISTTIVVVMSNFVPTARLAANDAVGNSVTNCVFRVVNSLVPCLLTPLTLDRIPFMNSPSCASVSLKSLKKERP